MAYFDSQHIVLMSLLLSKHHWLVKDIVYHILQCYMIHHCVQLNPNANLWLEVSLS